MVAAMCGISRGMYLENLFNSQVENAVRHALPAWSHLGVSAFRSLVEPLRRFTDNLDSVPNGLPFLLVVPHGLVSITIQLAMTFRGRCDNSDMADALFSRLISVPSVQPYLACSVVFGDPETEGVSQEEASLSLRAEGKSSLIIDELLALSRVRPEAIGDGGMLAGNSRHSRESECVPGLFRRDGIIVPDMVHQTAECPRVSHPYCLSRRSVTRPYTSAWD